MKRNYSLLIILILIATVSTIAYFFKGGSNGHMSDQSLNDFSIQDTSSISRIDITDAQGNHVSVVRSSEPDVWIVNDAFRAREDAVNLLLKTFKRLKVKSPVPASAKENIVRVIAGAGKKVEVYTGGENPEKIYYVGTATPDHFGTYMVLEIPGFGRSKDPFITHMEGFSGFLSTRFFAEENEWRHTGIFNYPTLDFRKVDVEHHFNPERSFSILYGGGNDLKLHRTITDEDVAVFDTLKVKDYLLFYKKIHLETYNNHLDLAGEDSLRLMPPHFTISVTDNEGKRNSLDLYWKSPIKQTYDWDGEVDDWDGDRMYGIYKGDIVLVQRFVFDPIIRPIDIFLK